MLLTPSCVFPREAATDSCRGKKGLGGLFLGGYKTVMNVDFLKEEGVTHVVNTAKGLETFGPKYTVSSTNIYGTMKFDHFICTCLVPS